MSSDYSQIELRIFAHMSKEKDMIDAFLKTPFSTVDRYSRRVKKLNDYEDRA
jgi:ribose 5-phosphate isomerase RpiB